MKNTFIVAPLSHICSAPNNQCKTSVIPKLLRDRRPLVCRRLATVTAAMHEVISQATKLYKKSMILKCNKGFTPCAPKIDALMSGTSSP